MAGRSESTSRRAAARPALPVNDMARSLAFFREKIGFSLVHYEGEFAILRRDPVEIHVWLAKRSELAQSAGQIASRVRR